MSTIEQAISRLRRTFDSGATRPIEWRLEQLDALRRLLEEGRERLLDALDADMHKSVFEGYTSDIAIVLSDIETARKNLRSWTKPEKVDLPFLTGIGASAQVLHEPLGVALVIGAWNYPIMLTLGPVVGAIAAGNAVLIKPSELSVNSAQTIDDLVTEYLDPAAFAVIQGGIPETTELLANKFDHIFFTGSPAIGRIVMAAAAKHLTPVTLELGGKSPAVVDKSADLEVAARRVTWGKFFNAGQTCVGVDYVLAHSSIYEELLDRITLNIRKFYGEVPRESPDLARIVNERNVERLAALIDDAKVVVGGEVDVANRYISPTVLRDVSLDDPVMGEEIFGPIMPVISFENADDALAIIQSGEKPLAEYIFASDREFIEKALVQTSSGGACVNDVLTHLTAGQAPFGGVGESGMGSYHGYNGYLTFTHRRTVLSRTTKFDPGVRYPPYTDLKTSITSRMV